MEKFEQTLVYKTPGDHFCKGGTYSYKPVKSQAELDSLLANGWYNNLQDAIENKDDSKDDGEEYSRPELEKMAEKLGIKFRSNITDSKLIEKINQVLGD